MVMIELAHKLRFNYFMEIGIIFVKIDSVEVGFYYCSVTCFLNCMHFLKHYAMKTKIIGLFVFFANFNLGKPQFKRQLVTREYLKSRLGYTDIEIHLNYIIDSSLRTSKAF